MDKKLILMICSILISIFSVILNLNNLVHSGEVDVSSMPPLNITLNNSLDKISKINLIASAVANEREYVLGEYDCTQFSERLSNELKEININAYCYAGIYINNSGTKTGHTWVEINDSELGIIEVEATGGYIIPNEVFKENYKPFALGRRFCY